MVVPSQGELHRHILDIAVQKSESMISRQYLEIIADRLSLTEEDLRERVPSGDFRARVNVEFGLSYLTRAGLLYRPSKGHFAVTSDGRRYLKSLPGPMTRSQINRLIRQRESGQETLPPISTDDDDASPLDKITAGYGEMQERLADELLESISHVSPDGFERLVVDLLEKMGYGKGEPVGRSGDGGIDGIIDQDALGLERVYMQAKRWQSQVGEPEIRNFSGSLDAHGASKGVFAITSRFSESAKQTAQRISAGNKFIRLIDGQELAKLMMDHGVGVVTQYTYKIQKLDENYFSEE